MQIEQLKERGQIKKGDLLLISDGKEIIQAKAEIVLVPIGLNREEIVFNKKKNLYFNVDMYLNGESWVKDVRIVRLHLCLITSE